MTDTSSNDDSAKQIQWQKCHIGLLSGISEKEMLDARAATEMSWKMDRFLHYTYLGYQLEEIKEHGLSFKITLSEGLRGCQEVKVDLLLSPYTMQTRRHCLTSFNVYTNQQSDVTSGHG